MMNDLKYEKLFSAGQELLISMCGTLPEAENCFHIPAHPVETGVCFSVRPAQSAYTLVPGWERILCGIHLTVKTLFNRVKRCISKLQRSLKKFFICTVPKVQTVPLRL